MSKIMNTYSDLSRAAELIFRGQPEILRQFRFPRSRRRRTRKKWSKRIGNYRMMPILHTHDNGRAVG